MRRRILFAILGTVALSLVLAGTGTYLLVRRQAVRTAEANLRDEAESLAGLVTATNPATAERTVRQQVVKGLRLEGIAVLVRGRNGVLRGDLPAGVTTDQVPPEALVPSQTLSGRSGDLTWAAATTAGPSPVAVTVVITRRTDPPAPPIGWYLVGGGAALAVGAAVAAWLSATLTRPLREAQAATVEIAAGDLSTRLPEPAPGATDEVAELTRSINAMATSLAHARGLERQFLLSVSHDLRTPLTSIRGYADAITDGTTSEPVDAARVISAEAQRLGRLVADLLDLARLDAREFSLHLRPVQANEVVVDTAEGFRPTADDAGVALAVVEAERAVESLVDPDRLAQAVANLVENALKHATSQVWVETQVDAAGGVAIVVTDDGPGIAPADLPHVFERLYVADRRPRRHVGGTGLGLAIVRQLVEGMGGTAAATSPALPDGRGARFAVHLPPAPPTAPPNPRTS